MSIPKKIKIPLPKMSRFVMMENTKDNFINLISPLLESQLSLGDFFTIEDNKTVFYFGKTDQYNGIYIVEGLHYFTFAWNVEVTEIFDLENGVITDHKVEILNENKRFYLRETGNLDITYRLSMHSFGNPFRNITHHFSNKYEKLSQSGLQNAIDNL